MKMFKGRNRIWTNASVLELMREAHPGEEPEDVVRRKAREAAQEALDAGWEGPPFKAEVLASFQGIEVQASKEPIGCEARVFATHDRMVRIEYDPSYPRTRVNYSIYHEVTHTFFPDCYERVRERGSISSSEQRHQELETLCDLGAAELLMPVAPFSNAVAQLGVSMNTASVLAEQYEASKEAVLRRMMQVALSPFAVVFLSEKLKPAEQIVGTTGEFNFGFEQPKPKLRVDYVMASSTFRLYVPRDKSVPDHSIAYSALNSRDWYQATEQWDVRGFGVRQVQAVALPRIPGQSSRVAVLLMDSFPQPAEKPRVATPIDYPEASSRTMTAPETPNCPNGHS